MGTRRGATQHLHIFEAGGRGGVFQHVVAVGELLVASGTTLVVHTARDHELPAANVVFCPCFDWYRSANTLRPARIAAHFFSRTLPHLLRQPNKALWVQGGFKLPLTLALILLARLFGRRVLFSPHNLFVRGGNAGGQFLLDMCLRIASRVIVYNGVDFAALRAQGRRASRIELFMYAPTIESTVMECWRREIEDHKISVCSIGQLRPDKNLSMLVEACAEAGLGLLIAGPDAGSGDELRMLAGTGAASNLRVHCRYLDLQELAAIVSLTGLVALPYSVASQSAVAVLARAYGAEIVALDIGGLSEQTANTVDDLAASTWAHALLKLSGRRTSSAPRTPLPPDEDAVKALVELFAD